MRLRRPGLGLVTRTITCRTRSCRVTIAPEGRKLLRLEVRNAQTPIERKPAWIKTRGDDGPAVHRAEVAGAPRGPAHGVRGGRLPQHLRVLGGPRGHLPHRRRAVHPALRLLPDRHRQARRPRPRRAAPGRRVASQTMGLRYATITGVARDDLPDGGAWLYAETVRQIHALNPGTGVELLIPDFNGDARAARPRCSTPRPRCSRTTSRRCRGSSSGSARRSATTARWRCITTGRARPGWSPSPT